MLMFDHRTLHVGISSLYRFQFPQIYVVYNTLIVILICKLVFI